METQQHKHKPHGWQNQQSKQNINNKPSNLFFDSDPSKTNTNLYESKDKH